MRAAIARDLRVAEADLVRRVRALRVFLALMAGLLAGASFAHPLLPPPDVRAAPGKPGWSVDQRTGCWLWNANPQPDQTVHWSEGCSPVGRATGRGVLEWRTGGLVTRYEGEWREGRADGHGVYRAKNGKVFEGKWIDGCFRQGNTRIAVGRPAKECR
jgi:hypothetical protein